MRRSLGPGAEATRRGFLSAWAVLPLTAASRRGAEYSPESETYIDEAAEFEITRFTDPSHSSWLPGGMSRFISSRRNLLVYVSERSGSLQAFRLDLTTGRHRQLTEVANLDPTSAALLEGDDAFVFFDGGDLFRASVGGGRPRLLYQPEDGWRRSEGFAVGRDSDIGALVEARDDRFRIRVVDLNRGRTVSIIERAEALSDPLPRPGRESLAYRSGDGIWLADYHGGEARRLSPASGTIGPVRWDSGGGSLFYLRLQSEGGGGSQLRELAPDSGEDRLVAETGGMVGFAPNSNGTVFAGVRNRAAGSSVVLVLRTGSELTICEHGASEPAGVAIAFSPDARSVYFHSDRDGGSAIYALSVEDLVEPTIA